ncbi:MAG: tetratricopeptide repeat protein [Acetobacteraceae bacterium]|nr:tetratricopeptide repeat protein [Acetobacteraceae bacterium]
MAATLLTAAAGPAPQRGAPRVTEPPAFGAYLIGRFAADQQDSRAAADNLLAALQADPNQGELLHQAFLAAVLDGRPEALRLARRLPDSPVAALVVLGSDAVAGRWDRAENRARLLGRQGPIGALQPVLVAWSMAGRGQVEQALQLLRPLAEAGRFRALNALHAALIADHANRPRDAERFIRLALLDQPEPTLRLAQLAANILHRAGKPAEAQRLLDGVAEGLDELALAAVEPARGRVLTGRAVSGPAEGIAEAYVALGAALRGDELEEMAAVLARLALRIRPQFGPALLLMGDVQAEAGDHAAALETLARIRPEDPLAAVALLRRAGVLDRMDQGEPALTLLREAADALPGQAQPLLRLGDALRRRGRFAEAATAYDEAIGRLGEQARAQDWPLFYARGIARERSGDWPGAEADFLRALDLAPEQPYVLNYLGYSWAEQGVNLPRAKAMLERAVELRPQDGNIADSLGWALFRTGDIAGAIRLLERAVELEPRNATINDHLGDAYWAAGRQEEARFQWRRALTMDPEAAEIARIERKLDTGVEAPVALDVPSVPTGATAAR